MGDDNVATPDGLTPELIDAWTRHARESARQLQVRQPSDTAIERDLLSFFRNGEELARDYFDKLPTHAALAAAAPAEDLAKALVAFDAQPRLHPEVHESDGTGMRYYDKRKFRNWGQTVANRPQLTFLPRTKQPGCAASSNGRARKATDGPRRRLPPHVATDLYSADGQCSSRCCRSTCRRDAARALEPDMDAASEWGLQGIALVGSVIENGVHEGAVPDRRGHDQRASSAAWCLDDRGGRWQRTLSAERRDGGDHLRPAATRWSVTAQAGSNATLSDLVHAIEFVNANRRVAGCR